jgi:hypothetical protein
MKGTGIERMKELSMAEISRHPKIKAFYEK